MTLNFDHDLDRIKANTKPNI